jgi:hypothetical protein
VDRFSISHGCSLFQFQKKGHHIFVANVRDCELGDIAKPLLYLIGRNEGLNRHFLEYGPHGGKVTTTAEYNAWLPQAADNTGVSNIVKTIAWLVDVRATGKFKAFQ